MATIHRSNVPIMSSKLKAASSKCKPIIEKEDKDISIVLLHALKSERLINEDLFFSKNCNFPPSLTSAGEMFHRPKLDLMHCLLEFVDTQKERPNSPTEIVIDTSFLIQLLMHEYLQLSESLFTVS